MARRGTGDGRCVVTFAAPIPNLLDRDEAWPRPRLAADALHSRMLPPPPPNAVPSPLPVPWFGGRVAGHFNGGPRGRSAPAVVGREVVDAFELIWPSGEIDEQFLGGPLSEMPAPGASYSDTPRSDNPSPPPLPMTVRLKPLTAPPEAPEPAWSEPVSDDVVLAIQRAIAAIGSELAVADESPLAPCLPGPSTVTVMDVSSLPAPSATGGDGFLPDAASDLSEARRSALKRLIGGLRRR
jgi:hypothetical protein